jgi:hypothetical protein
MDGCREGERDGETIREGEKCKKPVMNGPRELMDDEWKETSYMMNGMDPADSMCGFA